MENTYLEAQKEKIEKKYSIFESLSKKVLVLGVTVMILTIPSGGLIRNLRNHFVENPYSSTLNATGHKLNKGNFRNYDDWKNGEDLKSLPNWGLGLMSLGGLTSAFGPIRKRMKFSDLEKQVSRFLKT